VPKRLRREAAPVPSDAENWDLFGPQRIWANLMGNRCGIPIKDQQTIKESCVANDLFSFRNTDFLNKLECSTVQAILRVIFQTDAHHVIRQRPETRLRGVADLLERTKGSQEENDIVVVVDALKEFLVLNRTTSSSLGSSGAKTRVEPTQAVQTTSSSSSENTIPNHIHHQSVAAKSKFSDLMRETCSLERTLTVIDLTFLIFASYYAPRKETQDDERFAIFLKMFTSIVHGLTPKNMLVCLDSPSQLVKYDRFQSYKGSRRFDTRILGHFDKVGEFLCKCNLTTIRLDGYEADDLINVASKSWTAKDPNNRVVVITSDKDFFQICSERVWIYKYQKERRRYQLYRPGDVVDEYGIRPDQFVDYQCIVGDASDSVLGLDGVGKRTAVSMLQEHGTLLRIFQHAATIGDQVLLSQYTRVCVDNTYLLSFLNPEVVFPEEELLSFDRAVFCRNFERYLTMETSPIVRAEFSRRNQPGGHQFEDPFQ